MLSDRTYSGNHTVKLRIDLFRSYINGGVAFVSYCGQQAGLLDGLWTDKTYRFSHRQIILQQFNLEYCQNDEAPVEISITHQIIVEKECLKCVGDNFMDGKRNMQKVKIMSIKMCLH